MTKQQAARVYFNSMLPWRRALANRTVHRTVQGVDLYLPWSHMLPDYARMNPYYGQNLVELAAALRIRSEDDAGPLQVLDVGANIGDSALQIIDRTDARVLCVEGDPYWATYLHRNVDGKDRIVVEEALLTASEGEWGSSTPVREGGTTHFVQDAHRQEGKPSLPFVSAPSLRAKHPDFDRVRLVKSDTDGFDPVLVPAIASAWADSTPVLFFEFDPTLARAADARDPNALWAALADLGYTRLAIWDNTGDPLGQLEVSDATEQARTLEPKPVEHGYHFWDVAAAHGDDAVGLAVLDQLVPQPFSVKGTWR